jgi:cation transport ATPase
VSAEEQLPTERARDEDPTVYAAMQVAMQWKELDAAHLAAAMSAMEPSLRREHRERMARLEMQREAAQQAQLERQQQRAHRRHVAELAVGAVVALAMLGGGVYVAPHSWWLSTLLCGPSLLALAKIFVLRRSDPSDLASVTAAARNSTSAGTPPPVV